MRVSVIGTGYLGAVHAAGMAELGFETVGIDVDEAKVALLSEGKAPFFEPGLEPLLGKHIGEGGRLLVVLGLVARDRCPPTAGIKGYTHACLCHRHRLSRSCPGCRDG